MSVLKVGIYGKVPAHPDFISDTLHADISNELYDWAQTVMFHSREKMSESKWLPAYLVSPIWRMVVPKNELRTHEWVGVMVPSVDALGRYFPLFIVFETEFKSLTVEWLFKECTDLFKVMEEVAMSALQQQLNFLQLKRLLANKLEGFNFGQELVLPNSLNSEALEFSCEQPSTSNNVFLQRPLAQLDGVLLWTSSDINKYQKPFFKCRDLPIPSEYEFLLTGTAVSIQSKHKAMQS
ncbi:type VI secretion system-associated protein TagF [Marinomonas sp. RSW2]|uniref:Type VI secretion system-associated protein TagF n=1 Tax=Marinomonas maritima TaxID=2940935 RepID=A0ABT5WDR8_9GAMM|nr:type VI secretion system-associated protein TagF [Marinomonas maritima]MDE8602967.1 type VI secretion system-associated protein TagF [Marinomonas maritima]